MRFPGPSWNPADSLGSNTQTPHNLFIPIVQVAAYGDGKESTYALMLWIAIIGSHLIHLDGCIWRQHGIWDTMAVNKTTHASALWNQTLLNHMKYTHWLRLINRAPGWLSGLSLCLRLRSWSQGPGMEPRIGLSAQRGVCFSLSLCLPLCLLVISLCQINK